MGLSSITSRLLLQCTRHQRQLWSTLRQHKYYAAPAQVLMYLALTPAAVPHLLLPRAQFFDSVRDIPNVKLKIDLSVARCVCACQILFFFENVGEPQTRQMN